MDARPDLLTVTHDHRDDALVVHVAGEIDVSTGPTLKGALAAACSTARGSSHRLVLDLTGVRFLGSAGVHLLAATRLHCTQHDIPLSIVATTRAVLASLRSTGQDRLLRITDTVDAALDGTAAPRGRVHR